MREKEKRVVITFFTSAEAMATEKLCKAENLDGKLISAPRSLSADCGIAWSAPLALRDVLHETVEKNGIEYEGFHELLL